MWIGKAKALVDRHAVISFDIFDTLLLRPYLRPSDLFVHLEKLAGKKDFAQQRRCAEQRAREKHASFEDITFDEIYQELPIEMSSLKEQELALERQTLQANPQILEVFEYAKKQGKKIIIISDMYLPTDFLEQVLHEKGFVGFDKLYVSNVSRKTKTTGSLYKYVQQDLHVGPKDILHIGDNRRSDVRQAQKNGYSALLYPQAQKQFFDNHPRAKKLWNQHPNFYNSVILGIQVIRHQQATSSDYFSHLGYEIGGPTSYGFARWIERKALQNKTPDVLFAARDGYTLQRVFDTFQNPHFHTAYVYALRFLNRICRLDYHAQSHDQVLAVIKYFSAKSASLSACLPKQPLTAQQMHQFIQQHLDIINPLVRQAFDNYRAYLTGHIRHGKTVGIVDSITYSFSAQKLIESCLGKENVTGYYWSVIPSKHSTEYRFEHFLPTTDRIEDPHTFTHHWDFMEFLFTAPQPPIKDITAQGEPLYGSLISAQERVRVTSYQKLSDGAVSFAQDVYRIFGGKDIFLTAESLIQWVNFFLLHPSSEDIKEMSKIFHASDTNHTKYVPLLSYCPKLSEIWHHPKQYIRFCKQAYWRTPFQWILVCILSPIAIVKYSTKKKGICFFPRLRKRYFQWNIPIGSYAFVITWGRRGE